MLALVKLSEGVLDPWFSTDADLPPGKALGYHR